MYLSSFKLGDHPEHLVRLVDPSRPVAVIANAVDGDDEDRRSEAVQAEVDALGDLGLHADELDLRDFFDDPGQVAGALEGYGAAWLRGGNVFVLRHSLRGSGADAVLVDLLRRDAIVYAGYSAGACVLAPSLRGLEGCDDPDAVRRMYDAQVVWDGLAVLDYAIVPHLDSPGHPETVLVAEVARRYRDQGIRHTSLRDGQAIVIDGASTTIR